VIETLPMTATVDAPSGSVAMLPPAKVNGLVAFAVTHDGKRLSATRTDPEKPLIGCADT
jgi:hypothetical protein